MNKATDATETKSLSAFVLSLSLSTTKKSHVRAWEESQMQTRRHPSWFWMASTEHVCAWEPCSLEQGRLLSSEFLPMALLWCQHRPRRNRKDPSVQTLHLSSETKGKDSPCQEKDNIYVVGQSNLSSFCYSPHEFVTHRRYLNFSFCKSGI